MLHDTQDALKKIGAHITTQEITQQPELWQETFSIYQENETRIQTFIQTLKEKHSNLSVIFTGAGTSAYVGEVVEPFVQDFGDTNYFNFRDIATTTLVANPQHYFKKNVPTVLVSYARSGNSPESVATVELGQQLVTDFYQVTITCAKEGELAKRSENDPNNLLLLMPERSNDQGFAMTGSFSCMTLMSLLIFDEKHSLAEKEHFVKQIISAGNNVLEREDEIQALVNLPFNRVIYLGSGSLAGLAREVQLKILELTAGKVATLFDSSLGFRHGPKSFVDEEALVFLFVSNNPYTRQYDQDMIQEIYHDNIALKAMPISVGQIEKLEGNGFILAENYQDLPDAYLALPFAIFGQVVSLFTAIKQDNKPDTPSPTGTVNRVVKGVIIHEYSN